MDRRGFTLLETLVALAVLALVAALVSTRAAVALEQIGAHAAFQDLQTRVTALRLKAYGDEAVETLDLAGVVLRPGWTARAAGPLTVGPDGACASTEVVLMHGERVRARLAPVGRDCRFVRVS